jgi:ribosomal protein S18 acetylase RimI-like enzyme
MGASVTTTSALDNVIWHALNGPLRGFAEIRGRAGRLDPEVGPFAAIDDEASEESWADLAELTGPGRGTTLFRPDLRLPEGWTIITAIPCKQMVAAPGIGLGDERFEVLTEEDVPEMLALTGETQPGPFFARTIELGTYLGFRDDGALVAMAGERFRADGFTEVSAVCTKPTHQGRGLGGALTLAVTEIIQKRGDVAFLHVMNTNTAAISVYERIGFTVRREADATILRAPDAG